MRTKTDSNHNDPVTDSAGLGLPWWNPRAAAMVLGSYALVGGLVTFLGWAFDIYILTDWDADGISMKVNPSIAAMTAGLAVILLSVRRFSRKLWLGSVVRMLGGLTGLIGALTVLQHVSGIDLHIDTLLFDEPPGARATASPGRMGIPASICFLVSGTGLILLTGERSGVRAASWLGGFTIGYSSLCMVGYWYGASQLYTIPKVTGISQQMATMLCAIGIGIVTMARVRVPIHAWVQNDPGRDMLRRLTPPIILVPLILGAMRLKGEEKGLFDTRFGTALLVFVVVVTLWAILWWTATQLSISFTERIAAQAAHQESEGRLREAVEKMVETERIARLQAERIAQQKDEFVATVSHELRTPLNSILGWTHLLKRVQTQDQRLTRGLAIIERNARAQGQLISDLLDLGRMISGKLRLDPQRVDLCVAIASAVESFRPAAEEKGVSLELSMSAPSLPVQGDPERLQQIAGNLLSNAVKFTDRGGRVQVNLFQSESHIELTVLDTGKGIHPEFLPRMFERFSQQDSSTSRAHTGLGIGLSLVKQLVELHGGVVHAHSEGEGKGARFTVHLPITCAAAQEPAGAPVGAEASAHHDSSGKADLAGLRVLVVDDEPDARDMIRRIVTEFNGVVFTASSAEEAIRRLAGDAPDVLLSDIAMPRVDGYSLLKRIRESGDTIPAIALTAFAAAEDRDRAFEAGYQAHLTKPVDIGELCAALQAVVRRKVQLGGRPSNLPVRLPDGS